jgi:hypothetical protein
MIKYVKRKLLDISTNYFVYIYVTDRELYREYFGELNDN